jgi:hypothetical protein
MRTVLLLIAVLLLSCAAAAQTSSSTQAAPAVPQLRVQNQVGPRSALPQDNSERFRDWRIYPGETKMMDDGLGRTTNMCLKIRSYIFERQDGNAPRLVGMTTCTPASKFTAKRAVAPQWGVYPATAAPAAPAAELKH